MYVGIREYYKNKDKKDNRRLPGIREINLTADQVPPTGEGVYVHG